jgi:hypothetical protein
LGQHAFGIVHAACQTGLRVDGEMGEFGPCNHRILRHGRAGFLQAGPLGALLFQNRPQLCHDGRWLRAMTRNRRRHRRKAR